MCAWALQSQQVARLASVRAMLLSFNVALALSQLFSEAKATLGELWEPQA